MAAVLGIAPRSLGEHACPSGVTARGHVAEARPLRALASGLGDASTPCMLVGAALVCVRRLRAQSKRPPRRLRSVARHGSMTVRLGRLRAAREAKRAPMATFSEEFREGKIGRELEFCIDCMLHSLDLAKYGELLLRELQPNCQITYYTHETAKHFKTLNTSSIEAAILLSVSRRLLAEFPDDPLLTNFNKDILQDEFDFAQLVTDMLRTFWSKNDARDGLAEARDELTAENIWKWAEHASSFDRVVEEQGRIPDRYWVLKPMDNPVEFRRGHKDYAITLCLMEGGQQVVSAIVGPRCPELPLFYAARGHGSYVQLYTMYSTSSPRAWRQGAEMGVDEIDIPPASPRRRSRYYPANLPTRLYAYNKYETLDYFKTTAETDKLTVAMPSGLRQDISEDIVAVCEASGCAAPFSLPIENCLRYCYVGWGKVDVSLDIGNGLFDTRKFPVNTVDVAAAYLIAEESGAVVIDCNGDPIRWVGKTLSENAGCIVADPDRVPVQVWLKAIKEKTRSSEDKEFERFLKREKSFENIKLLGYEITQANDAPVMTKKVGKALASNPNRDEVLANRGESTKHTDRRWEEEFLDDDDEDLTVRK